MSDAVNHPSHYATVPGVECIDVVEHFPFCRGNAIKYLWRAGAKGDLVEDLRKAIWYIEREIAAYADAPESAFDDAAPAPPLGIGTWTEAPGVRTTVTRRPGCHHAVNGEHVPCPPACPVQHWPVTLFRRTRWRGRWVLRAPQPDGGSSRQGWH